MIQDFTNQFESIEVSRRSEQIWVTLNRPDSRNAMSGQMIDELGKLSRRIRREKAIRTVVLRGAGDHFCAGGDLSDMMRLASASESENERKMAISLRSRSFGHVLEELDTLPQAVIAVVHGAVMGGGVGLACVADVVIAEANTKFRLPETSLGVPPAQIMPFVYRRVGASQARRLSVLGGSLDAQQALQLGLVHEVATAARPLNLLTTECVERVRRCAPGALAATKKLVRIAECQPLAKALDEGAQLFADAVVSEEGQEGLLAFAEKRFASWARGRKNTLS